MLKAVVLLNIFVETDLFFRILWSVESLKEQHFIEIKILCEIINVFIYFVNLMYLFWK